MIGSFWQNPHLALNSSLFWWLVCLLLLAGFGAFYSIAKELNRKRKKDVFWTPKEKLIATVTSIAERASMIAIGAVLGTFGGIGYRDHQLSVNTFEYEGVLVVSQQSNRQYGMIIPGYPRVRDVEFCHEVKIPAPAIDMKFEQKFGCKQILGVGYLRPHKENNNELQTGRNSSSPAEAALW